jgi:predicted deacylase
LLQALTHGNEVCGAIALDWLLDLGFRPVRGTLSIVFANVAAYRSFDPQQPFASRCVDEDFNRLWTPEVLDGPRTSADLVRARELRPLYHQVDQLLDLHSMTDPCPPLALAGSQTKGLALARALGLPQHIVIDAGHTAGKRLRDYAFFDEPDDPRSALLVECGQHWEKSAPEVARQAVLRFLRHFGIADDALLRRHLDATPQPRQQVIEVTDVVTIASDDFAFAVPVHGLAVIPTAGTLLATDGPERIVTTYDDCVLVMPTRRPKRGETAVRLGRFVG